MANAAKVGEIFMSAGTAFQTLGELTSQLSPSSSSASTTSSGTQSGAGVKWTEEEVEMLHRAISNFATELSIISERIKGRTVQQIKNTLRKKAFEEAGMPLPTQQSVNSGRVIKASEVTLNALNASAEGDVDVETTMDFGADGEHAQ